MVGQKFLQYKSGIYEDMVCCPGTVNWDDCCLHWVLVVDFETTTTGKKYWKICNSWRLNWGYNGYEFIERENGMSYSCGMIAGWV
jgi:hypothetical protein